MKKGKKALIVILVLVLLSAAVTASAVFLHKTALKRALNSMDVNETDSIIRVMKLGGKNADIAGRVAQAYFDAGYKEDAALVSLYILQYSDSESTLAKEIINECYPSVLAAEFMSPGFKVQQFETVTRNGDSAYGVSDGIYCEFLGGYAKAKISPLQPQEIYAAQDGVYILDSNDSLIKFIKKDGSEISVIINEKADDFIYSKTNIYYIDKNGIPHGDDSVTLADGEFAMHLRIEADSVYCTVYDSNFEAVREQELKAS